VAASKTSTVTTTSAQQKCTLRGGYKRLFRTNQRGGQVDGAIQGFLGGFLPPGAERKITVALLAEHEAGRQGEQEPLSLRAETIERIQKIADAGSWLEGRLDRCFWRPISTFVNGWTLGEGPGYG
jgi:hypothetical protein